jgi:cytochrome c-type biogenesis protein CcmH
MMWNNIVKIALCSWLLSAHAASDVYPLQTEKQTAQFQHLLTDLRCLVCQNQNLADSNAPLARNLKQVIYEQVEAGHSDSEIIQYLTARYGDFILFNPPLKGITWLLWFGPWLFLGLGFWFYWHVGLQRAEKAGD